MLRWSWIALGFASALLVYSPLEAQEAPAGSPKAIDPKPCSDPAIETRRQANPDHNRGSNETLSDKLENSNGVLCPPPEVDPDIKAPTPDGGRTPVIPAPGTPGGDPTVQPK